MNKTMLLQAAGLVVSPGQAWCPETSWLDQVLLPKSRPALFLLRASGCNVHLVFEDYIIRQPGRLEQQMEVAGLSGIQAHVLSDASRETIVALVAKLNPGTVICTNRMMLEATLGVEDRVFVGQPGSDIVLDEQVMVSRSLRGWVSAWETCQAKKSSRLRLVT